MATPNEHESHTAKQQPPTYADWLGNRPEADVQAAKKRQRRMRLTRTIVVVVVLAVVVVVAVNLGRSRPPAEVMTVVAQSTTPTPSGESASVPETAPPGTSRGYDISSADSLTVLVNKHRSLNPPDYAPAELVAMTDIGVPSMNGHSLRREAAEAFQKMYQAASADGIYLDMTSGYRDYALQTELYNGYVASLGQEGADLTSARPGSSEHQTGLSADISAPGESDCILTECFANTDASAWLVAHSYEYGFILRYPQGQTAVTGYEFEPWHYRFIGLQAAADYHASGATSYEEFLGAEAAPGYLN